MREGDLARCINKLHLPNKLYLGTFTYKKIPRSLECSQFAILHRYIKTTGHWFCIIKTSETEAELFDSLIPPQSVINFLTQRLKCRVTFNTSRTQSRTSKSCGMFCIYYLFNRIFNLDLLAHDYFEDFFSSSCSKNEHFLKEFASAYQLQ